MKILAISDEECPGLWDYYTPDKLRDYDFIISCGDLKASYLSFLVTLSGKRLLYVHGNHDTDYDVRPPQGCDCIDDQFVIFKGLRILGLGGSIRYNNGSHQYTEAQMRRRILRLRYWLWRYQGVDIVVTHSPPLGLGDRNNAAHRGFAALVDLIDRYQPQYLLHGHVHMRYQARAPRILTRGSTQIVNVSERWDIEAEPRFPMPPRYTGGLLYRTRPPRLPEDRDLLYGK